MLSMLRQESEILRERRGEEGRVLMEGDIGTSHITTSVRNIHTITILCPRVAKKYAFESMRGDFG